MPGKQESRWLLWGLGSVVLLVALGTAITLWLMKQTVEPAVHDRRATAQREQVIMVNTPEPDVIRVSAEQLSEEYYRDRHAAEEKYAGRVVEVTGVVDMVGEDWGHNWFVDFGGGRGPEELFRVIGRPIPSEVWKVKNLVEGQKVVMRGRPEFMGNITLQDAVVVEP